MAVNQPHYKQLVKIVDNETVQYCWAQKIVEGSFEWRLDTQRNDIQLNYTQHSNK